MTDTPANQSADTPELTAVERAIRARELERIRQEREQPKPSWQRRASVIALTVCAVLVVVLMINFVVTGMNRIIDIWYPGAISGQAPAAQQTRPGNGVLKGDEPFMIGVVTEPSAQSSSSAPDKSTTQQNR